jgi:hypothetical protein
MEPYGVVIASPAPDNYDPFAITEPDFPPTPEGSMEIIGAMWENSESPEDFLSQMSMLHFAQATVIRGERYLREKAEAELLARELHHFETEQMVAGASAVADALEENWEQGDLAGAVNQAIGFLRGMAVTDG